jgi:hypothetical protein
MESKPQDVVAVVQGDVFTAETATGMPLTVRYAKRTIHMHTLTEVELDTVASLSNSVHLGMLGISAGSLVAFVITLMTVPIVDSKIAAVIAGLTFVSALATMFFGGRSFLCYRDSQRKLREIKGQR